MTVRILCAIKDVTNTEIMRSPHTIAYPVRAAAVYLFTEIIQLNLSLYNTLLRRPTFR